MTGKVISCVDSKKRVYCGDRKKIMVKLQKTFFLLDSRRRRCRCRRRHCVPIMSLLSHQNEI